MLTFRAFAAGILTLILKYSRDGDKNVSPREAMKNLAMSQVVDGANFWDAPGHSMAGSNDKATRTEIFQWIEKNEKILSPRASPCILWACTSRPRAGTMIHAGFSHPIAARL